VDKQQKMKVLEELGGIPEEIFDELFTLFIEKTTELLKDLRSAMGNNDKERVAQLVHTIKGSASNLRFTSFAECAFFVEKALREGQDVSAALRDLEEEFLRLKAA
jgi:HPt (histidine-containing phosphotransfer) domain-containing protein